jgi:hypothetical protein
MSMIQDPHAARSGHDALDEMIAEFTESNPGFPELLRAAEERRTSAPDRNRAGISISNRSQGARAGAPDRRADA